MTLHINLKICFDVFLNNCRDNMIHEYPKCKQTNMKLVHPQAARISLPTDKTFTDYKNMLGQVDGNLRVGSLVNEKKRYN